MSACWGGAGSRLEAGLGRGRWGGVGVGKRLDGGVLNMDSLDQERKARCKAEWGGERGVWG